MVGGILERAGPKLFMTSLLVTPDGRIKGKIRKITISKEELSLGLSPGKIFTSKIIVRKYNLGVLVDTDLFAPEYARLQKILGAQFFIAFFKRRLRKGNIRTIVKSLALARAIETSSPVLLCGGIVEHHGEILYSTPSMIVTPNGVEHEAVNEEKILFWDLSELNNNDFSALNPCTVSYRSLSDACKELSKLLKYR